MIFVLENLCTRKNGGVDLMSESDSFVSDGNLNNHFYYVLMLVEFDRFEELNADPLKAKKPHHRLKNSHDFAVNYLSGFNFSLSARPLTPA